MSSPLNFSQAASERWLCAGACSKKGHPHHPLYLRRDEAVRDFVFASHASAEPGFARACQELSLRPYLELEMRLGEGSGCPLAFQLLAAAEAMMAHMATFGEAAIDDSYLAALSGGGR